jgi:hypothetical protein
MCIEYLVPAFDIVLPNMNRRNHGEILPTFECLLDYSIRTYMCFEYPVPAF